MAAAGESEWFNDVLLNNLKEQLKVDEGYRDHVYLDSEDLPTFGIGHLITKSDPEYGKPVGTKVDEGRIDTVFRQDIQVIFKYKYIISLS